MTRPPQAECQSAAANIVRPPISDLVLEVPPFAWSLLCCCLRVHSPVASTNLDLTPTLFRCTQRLCEVASPVHEALR